MSDLTPARLKQVFDRIERTIEERWGVPVTIKDVPNPFTGDLDGEQIHIDHDIEVEDALFILVHLFGHTIQWNLSEELREIAFLRPEKWTDELLARLAAYEKEACQYSLQLLHEVGIHDLDQWIADFAACDAAYLLHFYKTGEKRAFRSFWTDGNPVLTPKAIPEFTPTVWLARNDGVVI